MCVCARVPVKSQGKSDARTLCVAVCRSVLQCVAMHCNTLQCVPVKSRGKSDARTLFVASCCIVLQCVAVYCSVLQCIVVCCNMYQQDYKTNQIDARTLHFAACWSALQYVAVRTSEITRQIRCKDTVCCSVLQCVAVYCNALQCVPVKSQGKSDARTLLLRAGLFGTLFPLLIIWIGLIGGESCTESSGR